MQTGNATYLIFVAAVFFLYWGANWSCILRLAVIIFANLLFCAHYSLAYVVIVPACALVDFMVGLALSRTDRPGARRLWLACSVGLNLAILLGLRKLPALASGPAAGLSFWPLALPLGLSFYALQSLTYTIDLYRKDGECIPGFAQYLSAAAFFPMLEAGPISRLTDLAGQLSKQRGLSREDGGRAFFWICSGMIKKALVADYLSRNLVNRVFDTPNLYSGFEVLVGVYAYSLQIYYDFSGYTDIARGAALLMGIRLPPNFNSPYLAANLTEFWRRWHMSFSNWLRDYLYFSLPGGRTKFMPYLNLVITMVLAGLWHGVSATFALWGLLHGLGLAATRGWWALVGGPRKEAGTLGRFLTALLTYHFVCLTWILFRATSVENALAVMQRIGSWTVGWENLPLPLCAVLAASAMALVLSDRLRTELSDQFAQSPSYVHAIVLLAVAIGIQMLRGNADTPFVYSRF